MTRRRVTIVTAQLLGYQRTGGVGAATTFLALGLARAGYRVDVLYVGDPAVLDEEWARVYEEAGTAMRVLPVRDVDVDPPYFARIRGVELALRADPPDVVVAHEFGAPAYAALRLRRLGLAFERTVFVVFCHGTRFWVKQVNRNERVSAEILGATRLERACAELADVVVSPSAYLVEWMTAQGWQLPETTRVIPLVTRSAATGEPLPVGAEAAGTRVEEITFFGRLEDRKGIEPFVAGVNALPRDLLGRVELTFIGRATKYWGPDRVASLLSETARRALRGVTFETELVQHEALARLSRPGTLAVIPSVAENSPNVVYECLERRIPFLASDVGGIGELVAPEDRSRVLFEPSPAGIASALARALSSDDALRPARAAFDGDASVEAWSELVRLPPQPVDLTEEPPAADVIAGSPALDATNADWVVLLDAGDAPDSDLVETLTRAQAASGADVVTCGVAVDGREHFFSGDPGGLGLLANQYGTAALVRRALLEDVATPWPANSDLVWPLLARLSAAGAQIVSVPLPLVQRTRCPGRLERDAGDALLVVEEIERALPAHLRSLARLAAGLAADAQPH